MYGGGSSPQSSITASHVLSPSLFDSLQITTKSPKWVGAWWIGFIIAGCMSLVVSIVLCGFPKYLPGRKEVQKLKVRVRGRRRERLFDCQRDCVVFRREAAAFM